MADEHVHTGGPEAPPPGEAIHLPGPSYLPVVLAAGVTIAVVGVVISWFIVGAGLIVVLIVLRRWIKETRQDIGELPLEH